MTVDIIHEGMEIECVGNPAQKTQFKIFCENPDHNDIMVGIPADGRKFSNWSDVIAAATKQAGSRILRIEVYEDLVYERDQLEERSDFEKVAGVVLTFLILAAVYMIFTTMRDFVPAGFMG